MSASETVMPRRCGMHWLVLAKPTQLAGACQLLGLGLYVIYAKLGQQLRADLICQKKKLRADLHNLQ